MYVHAHCFKGRKFIIFNQAWSANLLTWKDSHDHLQTVSSYYRVWQSFKEIWQNDDVHNVIISYFLSMY